VKRVTKTKRRPSVHQYFPRVRLIGSSLSARGNDMSADSNLFMYGKETGYRRESARHNLVYMNSKPKNFLVIEGPEGSALSLWVRCLVGSSELPHERDSHYPHTLYAPARPYSPRDSHIVAHCLARFFNPTYPSPFQNTDTFSHTTIHTNSLSKAATS